MLVLTRRKGERVVILGIIEIVILGIQGEQVRLGIVAPRWMPVHRQEVWLEILAEKGWFRIIGSMVLTMLGVRRRRKKKSR